MWQRHRGSRRRGGIQAGAGREEDVDDVGGRLPSASTFHGSPQRSLAAHLTPEPSPVRLQPARKHSHQAHAPASAPQSPVKDGAGTWRQPPIKTDARMARVFQALSVLLWLVLEALVTTMMAWNEGPDGRWHTGALGTAAGGGLAQGRDSTPQAQGTPCPGTHAVWLLRPLPPLPTCRSEQRAVPEHRQPRVPAAAGGRRHLHALLGVELGLHHVCVRALAQVEHRAHHVRLGVTAPTMGAPACRHAR